MGLKELFPPIKTSIHRMIRLFFFIFHLKKKKSSHFSFHSPYSFFTQILSNLNLSPMLILA
jgi:hypothetical protein